MNGEEAIIKNIANITKILQVENLSEGETLDNIWHLRHEIQNFIQANTSAPHHEKNPPPELMESISLLLGHLFARYSNNIEICEATTMVCDIFVVSSEGTIQYLINNSVSPHLLRIFDSTPADSEIFGYLVRCIGYISSKSPPSAGIVTLHRTNIIIDAIRNTLDPSKSITILQGFCRFCDKTNNEELIQVLTTFFIDYFKAQDDGQPNIPVIKCCMRSFFSLQRATNHITERLSNDLESVRKIVQLMLYKGDSKFIEGILLVIRYYCESDIFVATLLRTNFIVNLLSLLEEPPCDSEEKIISACYTILDYVKESAGDSLPLSAFYDLFIRHLCDIKHGEEVAYVIVYNCNIQEIMEINAKCEIIPILLDNISYCPTISISSVRLLKKILSLGSSVETCPEFEGFNPYVLKVAECGGVEVLRSVIKRTNDLIQKINEQDVDRDRTADKILAKYFGEDFENFMIKRRGNATKSARK